MHVASRDVATLLELAKADRAALAAKTKLEELPQRMQILGVRKKRESILEKQASVLAMREAAEADLARISDEDSALAEKQAKIQAAIDSSRGDFRNVEAHTKELNGAAKRRSALEEELAEVDARIGKVEAVQAQIDAMLASLDAEEQSYIESFRAHGGELRAAIAAAQKAASQYADQLPDELVQLYRKTAKRCAGVAISVLENNRCSVCRSTIDESHLIELRASRPLGVCPSCKRLIVIDVPEQ